jgi:hypothetical protein
MANQKEIRDEDYARHWMTRIQNANEHFESWENTFKCRTLQNYIEGKQRERKTDYVLNLFYSSIKVKKPSLLFARPTFTLAPKPWKIDWNPDTAFTVSKLKEDTLNSTIQDSALKFSKEIDMAILDSWSYFGVIEVGYSANWISNPNAGRPILKSDYYEMDAGDKEGKTIAEPDEIPEKEFIYFRRIPAHRFRVGGTDSHDLERCNWCGYYDFVRTSDLLANKKYFKNLNEKDWPNSRSDDFYYDPGSNPDHEANFTGNGDYTKVWKIWDNRAKDFIILMQTPEKCLVKKSFKRLPLFGLKFDERRMGWFPIPVTYNWKGPQDEINESREQGRKHRRRVRQFHQAMEGTIEPDEVQKFISSPDGTLIWTKRDNAIQPVQNSPLDSSIMQSFQIGAEEFDKISATSNNQRGVSDRTTATESNTIETRTRIREESDQIIVAEWLCSIAKETLLTIIERFSEDFWIKRSADEQEIGEEIQDLRGRYELINSEMLDDESEFDLNITVTSMSPVSNEIEKRKFFEFMAIIKTYDVMSLHPTIIREAAFRCDYRNEQVIKALQKMAQLALVAKAEEGKQNLSAQNVDTNMAQNQAEQQTPPDQAEIINQITNQMQ